MMNNDEPELEMASDAPTIRSTNMILLDMVNTGTTSRVVTKADELPEGGEYSRVVNRLKVMSSLDPVTYQEPVDGVFEVRAFGNHFMVKTHFDDGSQRPHCRIEIGDVKRIAEEVETESS